MKFAVLISIYEIGQDQHCNCSKVPLGRANQIAQSVPGDLRFHDQDLVLREPEANERTTSLCRRAAGAYLRTAVLGGAGAADEILN